MLHHLGGEQLAKSGNDIAMVGMLHNPQQVMVHQQVVQMYFSDTMSCPSDKSDARKQFHFMHVSRYIPAIATAVSTVSEAST